MDVQGTGPKDDFKLAQHLFEKHYREVEERAERETNRPNDKRVSATAHLRIYIPKTVTTIGDLPYDLSVSIPTPDEIAKSPKSPEFGRHKNKGQ